MRERGFSYKAPAQRNGAQRNETRPIVNVSSAKPAKERRAAQRNPPACVRFVSKASTHAGPPSLEWSLFIVYPRAVELGQVIQRPEQAHGQAGRERSAVIPDEVFDLVRALEPVLGQLLRRQRHLTVDERRVERPGTGKPPEIGVSEA
jgi:hypothetical protein